MSSSFKLVSTCKNIPDGSAVRPRKTKSKDGMEITTNSNAPASVSFQFFSRTF
jgi:hypothetical protein